MHNLPGTVAILAYDGLCTFEFGIAVEIFGLARPEVKYTGHTDNEFKTVEQFLLDLQIVKVPLDVSDD